MSILSDIYHKSLAANAANIRFWEDYLRNLKSLDFSIFSDKLKVPALVPIGSRVLFRGELKHTNEVTIALGADYFVKCSLKQAEVLRQHRIKKAQSNLEIFQNEKEYLENQLSFKHNAFDDHGQEIIEVHTEDEDKAWRQKHRENVRQYKQKGEKEQETVTITDNELWERLEELELQEELDNEILSSRDSNEIAITKPVDITKEENYRKPVKDTNEIVFNQNIPVDSTTERNNRNPAKEEVLTKETREDLRPTPKFELLQKVIDKQNELEGKLLELKNKERSQSKTENDLMSRLDEMEKLDELEDEMDRLDDILETQNIEDSDDSTSKTTEFKKGVSFVDNESETLQITFKHSDAESSAVPYNKEEGITKPSDIYEAYPHLFAGQTKSILKKSKYESSDIPVFEVPKVERKKKSVGFQEDDAEVVEKTIVVSDVVEKLEQTNKKLLDVGARPTSLFKKRRQQMKS